MTRPRRRAYNPDVVTRTLTLLRVALVVSAAGAQGDAPPSPAGKLEVTERVHDAGRIDRGEPLSHSFVLRNTGTGDLHVDAKPG